MRTDAKAHRHSATVLASPHPDAFFGIVPLLFALESVALVIEPGSSVFDENAA